ncbi:anti-sigma factor [Nocardioides hwasunensis]|uniref:Anti-sigma factor n=1 Tax=Nocardioides hwasunensis TaxID=397258 RepID=A0ABR8MD88_9ACTN|nr:anti-sigma factor [Nocardioides hwasunensis]MBD3913922.1 anti-sigma factor [Nocardioides hwasunensis]
MSHVDLDVLADLALDPTDAPEDVREHVASCPDCTALLASLGDVRRLAGAEPLVSAPAGLRDRVLAEARSTPQSTDRPADDTADRPPPPVPLVPSRARRRRIPAWAAGLAAVVTLLAGLGLGRLTAGETSPAPEERATVVAATALTSLDSDAPRGTAEAVRDDGAVTLRVSARELGDAIGFHEVWLINVDGTRMVSLGVLASGDTGEFQVPRGVLEDGYRIVDISVEPHDGDPTHSGVSLARGELA